MKSEIGLRNLEVPKIEKLKMDLRSKPSLSDVLVLENKINEIVDMLNGTPTQKLSDDDLHWT